MEPLPPCEHRNVAVMASWQADLAGRVMCQVCGADAPIKPEQMEEYDRLSNKDPQEAAKYLVGLLGE